ncbi:MAG: class I tRNA ligase family protein, partial [Bdellovibrionota bacterium]
MSAHDTPQQRNFAPPADVATVLAGVKRPKRVVVTGGMPYATGPLHLGHLAGAHVPPDILARYFGMLIGRKNVLFVCGTDDHGSTSEVAALQAGIPIREYIDGIHAKQKRTMDRYSIGLDVFTGTSRPETYATQVATCQEIFRKLYQNGMLDKRVSRQWYDPKIQRFLPDRFVRGKCPNPKCEATDAYSDICDTCGLQYHPDQLGNPRSAVSDAIPELRETTHWWLNMWKVAEVLRIWIEGRKSDWRAPVIADVLGTILPAIRFEAAHEEAYKGFKAELPKHKSKYAPGKRVVLQFDSRAEMETGRKLLADRGIESVLLDEWAHRSITRDVSWGIPLPAELDPEMQGKTLYVWPDSLIAPIAFTQTALSARGESPERWREFWQDPESRVFQFLGQDNVFFYVIMQGAMWIGSQADVTRLPIAGELQLTDVFGCFLLLVA